MLQNGHTRLAPVALARLAEETRCPVCFGILKQTVTSTVCLHRFCASCIDTCLSGRPPQHKDCPVCRANLHSRRALRPDPNFDRLLKALYGDVVVYGQQEDALVAVNVQLYAAQMPTAQQQHRQQQQVLRRSQSQDGGAVEEGGAAVANGPQPQRRTSQAGGGRSSAAGHPTGCNPSNGVCGSAAALKRQREETGGGGDGGPPGGCPEDGPGAKRHHSTPALGGRAVHPGEGTPSPHLSRVERWQAAAGAASPKGAAAAVPYAGIMSSPASPRPQARPSTRMDAAGSGATPGSSRGSPAAKQAPSGRPPGSASAAGEAAIAAATAAPRGPLAVPAARSASELSFRHPGMVLVRLQPGVGTEDGAADVSACGRSLRPVVPPALEKPFLLCPAKWTVAHIAQLLSQWLPPRGFGSAAVPLPPSAIRLEAAPGEHQAARHRCLRGCTALSSLAAEHARLEGTSRGSATRGGTASNTVPLVLQYSIVQPQ